jgi:hypothetical protein
MLLALGFGVASCARAGYISPNDPQYARSGAPRAGEPALRQSARYMPLGSDGTSGGGNSGGGM